MAISEIEYILNQSILQITIQTCLPESGRIDGIDSIFTLANQAGHNIASEIG